MKFLLFGIFLFNITVSFSQNKAEEHQEKHSPYVITTTDLEASQVVNNLKSGLDKRNLTLFSEVAHHKGAENIGKELSFTHLLIFGKPEIGTKLMLCDQSVGLELPLKILVYSNGKSTSIKYQKPQHLKEHHNLEDCLDILTNMDEMLILLIKESTIPKE